MPSSAITFVPFTPPSQNEFAFLLSTFNLTVFRRMARISVFAERGNIWTLTEDFSSENLKIIEQLLSLRDSLSIKARLFSFPADALKKLKNSFDNKYTDYNYCQVLISNLISAPKSKA